MNSTIEMETCTIMDLQNFVLLAKARDSAKALNGKLLSIQGLSGINRCQWMRCNLLCNQTLSGDYLESMKYIERLIPVSCFDPSSTNVNFCDGC